MLQKCLTKQSMLQNYVVLIPSFLYLQVAEATTGRTRVRLVFPLPAQVQATRTQSAVLGSLKFLLAK